ncbi:hypothetical protein EUX98_g8276 [Antrodiella citrinella]|uniref:Uncharacterized protein n=1 Tax=Antrodiella citrinella TaxID=2447956 RepID=A0A4S4M8Y7_9APHY|nr:hypothetical protein EUX98_g8276 [Antrodiella citrinella]
MPTVPPIFHLPDVVLPGIADQIEIPDTSNGPTPDPDLDDVVLLPRLIRMNNEQPSLDQAPTHTNPEPRPHLSLAGLTLHSPSSIIGTPFDVSEPRFEYPFPETSPEPQFYQGSSFPAYSGHVSSFSPATMTSAPSSVPPSSNRPDNSKAYFPIHPKHQPRDPPVPPSLTKKRWSAGNMPSLQLKSARARSPTVSKAERGTTAGTTSEETQSRPGLIRKLTARSAREGGLKGDVAKTSGLPKRIKL